MSLASRLVTRRLRVLASVVGALGLLSVLATAASAQSVQPYNFAYSFDGALSTAGPLGATTTDVAANDVTGRVYALHRVNGSYYLEQFEPNGNPAPFSALKGASSIRLPIASEEGGPVMTVDNTGGPTQGRIFISSPETGNGEVLGFNPDGTPVGAPFPIEGHPFGLAVNPITHDLWADQHFGAQGLARYTPEYAQTTTFYSLDEQIAYRIAIDPEGNFYVNQWRGTTKYNEAGKYLYSLEYTGSFPTRNSVAVDQKTADVFLLEEKEGVWRVTEFNSRGTKIETFGAGYPDSIYSGNPGIEVDTAWRHLLSGMFRRMEDTWSVVVR